MQTITCDVCRKKIENALTGRNFYYYCEFSVCESCRENIENQIKPTIRTKNPFSYEWYGKLLEESISKAIQKGKSKD